jgi:hypothetical protein
MRGVAREGMGPNSGEVVVTLRDRICYMLALLRVHSPECEHCNARVTCGNDILKRLEELNGRTQPSPLHNENQGDVAEGRDSQAA